ncbi:MAG: biofilm-associated protein, partial [Nitrosopumilaceae archaeon]
AKGESVSITLGPDGKKDYELDLTSYSSGVYTAVLQRGNAQAEYQFSVGLQTGSGEVKIGTTKENYKPGDPILILGNSGPTVIITLTLLDPDGNEVKTDKIFTDKEGTLSLGTFRIPSDGKFGIWTIRATSGSNYHEIHFDVTPDVQQGMSIIAVEVTNPETSHLGRSFEIKGFGAPINQPLTIEIFSTENDFFEEQRVPSATKEGDFKLIWFVPKDTAPGTYTIKAIASDQVTTAETTIEV